MRWLTVVSLLLRSVVVILSQGRGNDAIPDPPDYYSLPVHFQEALSAVLQHTQLSGKEALEVSRLVVSLG